MNKKLFALFCALVILGTAGVAIAAPLLQFSHNLQFFYTCQYVFVVGTGQDDGDFIFQGATGDLGPRFFDSNGNASGSVTFTWSDGETTHTEVESWSASRPANCTSSTQVTNIQIPTHAQLRFSWATGSAGVKLSGKFEGVEVGSGSANWLCSSNNGESCTAEGHIEAGGNKGTWVRANFITKDGKRQALLVVNDVQCSTAAGFLPQFSCIGVMAQQKITVVLALPNETSLIAELRK